MSAPRPTDRAQLAQRGGLALLGAVSVAVAAQVTVPMVPVPMTLQTLAVGCVGLLAGPRWGAAATGVYVLAVLLGLPILADGASAGGAAFFTEPSIGYVVAFVPAAAVAGWAHRRGLVRAFGAACAAHVVVLAIGGGVLAGHIGIGAAWTYGVGPFLVGGGVKSALAAGVAAVWWARRP